METVRDLRIAAGLTQAELANRSGVARSVIAAYESGERRPSSRMLARLQTVARPRPSRVIAEHRDQIIALASRHKAHRVRVFGSASRGDDISGSDIDLLVRFDPDADLFDMADLVFELEELTGLHVDVVSERGLPDGPHPIRDEAKPL
ncbi:helix-turn-helix domain-containing protein [Nocardia caishijiensis]|uniref:helix-turn-helix domain-containing protein n=1 Tax=Nocardia caishijiensis TaxID=184756 RepID=UPI0009FCF3E9|nr:XRE family transcriptional regulator [Nocardia caishijiensis]